MRPEYTTQVCLDPECPHGNEPLPADRFRLDGKRITGLDSICTDCRAKRDEQEAARRQLVRTTNNAAALTEATLNKDGKKADSTKEDLDGLLGEIFDNWGTSAAFAKQFYTMMSDPATPIKERMAGFKAVFGMVAKSTEIALKQPKEKFANPDEIKARLKQLLQEEVAESGLAALEAEFEVVTDADSNANPEAAQAESAEVAPPAE